MEFTGRYILSATPQSVWDGLNDTAMLKACIPGCQTLTRTSDDRFDAVATLRIGPVKASFKAVIHQTERDPPRRCVLKGEGQGGVAGFARGEAEVTLSEDAGGTALAYIARANIGGKLAQVGQRLIDSAARQIADDFFARFAAQVTASSLAEKEKTIAAAPPPPPTPVEATPPHGMEREGLAPAIWVSGLVGVIAILLVLFRVAF